MCQWGENIPVQGMDTDFTQNSAMTLITFDLKTWFKVIAHPLPQNTLGIMYEPDWAKGWGENMPRILIVEKTDGEQA